MLKSKQSKRLKMLQSSDAIKAVSAMNEKHHKTLHQLDDKLFKHILYSKQARRTFLTVEKANLATLQQLPSKQVIALLNQRRISASGLNCLLNYCRTQLSAEEMSAFQLEDLINIRAADTETRLKKYFAIITDAPDCLQTIRQLNRQQTRQLLDNTELNTADCQSVLRYFAKHHRDSLPDFNLGKFLMQLSNANDAVNKLAAFKKEIEPVNSRWNGSFCLFRPTGTGSMLAALETLDELHHAAQLSNNLPNLDELLEKISKVEAKLYDTVSARLATPMSIIPGTGRAPSVSTVYGVIERYYRNKFKIHNHAEHTQQHSPTNQ